jgi:NADPH:quinone reductase-like Zn-dependent oxidoreductase
VAYGGNIALIGVLAGLTGETNPHPIMRKGASMHGIFVGNRAMFERMNRAIEVNGLRPVVDRVLEFEEAAEAYRYQQSASLFGKVVIRI